uniref:Uncharacterized protein n=1 Tax=Apis cerana TaxID=7461 RepID=V9IFM4_APICE
MKTKERSKNEKVSILTNNTYEESSLSISKIANSSSSSSITSTSLLAKTERHSNRNISSDENLFKLSSDVHTHSESKRKHRDDKSSRSQRHKDRRDRDRRDKEHKRHHHRSPQSNKYENKTGEINKEDSLKIISLSKDCNISSKTTDRTDSKDSDRKLEKRRDGHHSHARDGQKKSSNRSSKDDTASSRSHSSSSNHKRKSNSSERKESKKACIEKNITTAVTEQNTLGNTLTLITVTTVAQSTTTNTFVST